MNQTQIDYLFSTTAPPTDRAGLGRRGESPFGFTDHLSSAAESRGQSEPRDDRAKPSLASPPPATATSNDSSSRSRPDDVASSTTISTEQAAESDRDESASATEEGSQATDSPSPNETTAQTESDPSAESPDDEPQGLANEEATDDDESATAEAAVAAAEFLTAEIDAPKTLHEGGTSDGADAATAAVVEFSDADVNDSEAASGNRTTRDVAVAVDFQDKLAAAENATETAAAGDEPNAPAITQQAQPGRKKSAISDKSSEAASGKAKRGATSSLSKEPDSEVASSDETKSKLAAKDFTGDTDAPKDKNSNVGESRRGGAAPIVARNENLAAVTSIVAQAQTAAAADSNAVAANSDSADTASVDATKPGAQKQDGLNSLLDQSRSASAAKRSGRGTETEETPRVDPARFVGRVAKAFHTAAERGGTLQLRLAPPELGAVRIELTITDGIMSAQLETETSSAKRVLLEHLPALRERLAEQNIRIERFDVDVRDDGRNGQAQERMTQQQRQQQEPNQPHSRRQTTDRLRGTQPAVADTVISARISSTGINLVV